MVSAFISYSRADKLFAQRLAQSLSDVGIEIWIDTEDIPAGVKWSSAVQRGLDVCETMIVVISPDSMASRHVEDEWQYYLDEGKPIVPVLLRPSKVPFQLRRIQYIDFQEQDYEVALARLVQTLSQEETAQTSREKTAYELLQRGHQQWTTFEKKESLLLDKDSIDLINQYVGRPTLSAELMHYLLLSIANLKTLPQLDTEKIRGWLDILGDTTVSQLVQHLLADSNPRIREGVVRLIKQLEIRDTLRAILNMLDSEIDIYVIRACLQTVSYFEASVPREVAERILETNDWLIQTLALQNLTGVIAALLISDGTEFAAELGAMAGNVGYRVVTLPPDSYLILDWELQQFDLEFLKVFDLLILTRGEHFTRFGNDKFYTTLNQFVFLGGTLLATSWVGWETKANTGFSTMLPFTYHAVREDVTISCKPTNNNLALRLFDPRISYLASFESMSARPNTITLLETDSGNPVFGYRQFGSGICYYLNTCQHSCAISIPSPLQTSTEFRASFQRVLQWIYETRKPT